MDSPGLRDRESPLADRASFLKRTSDDAVNSFMAEHSNIPQACTDELAKMSGKVDGRPVLYATRFARPDGNSKSSSTGAVARLAMDAAMREASQTIARGIPNDGWLVATPVGIHVFKKSLTGGIGSPLGTLTSDVIAGVSVAHGKKATRTQITITMIDQSFATLSVRTAETYPALSPWIRGQSSDDNLANRLPEGPIFDTEELLRSMPGH
jgi:hypothetical protein